ncbi:MAG: vanadium-dependent haloperoxidase [Gammaproteobacteria bacterium]|nr:vanadium-dependent haloperoxidase [Gammaproteobacteria bacterium]
MNSRFLACLATCLFMLIAAASAEDAPPDALIAVSWNETVLRVAEAEDGFLTLKGLRTAAMLHVAMHDALSAINGRYEQYAYRGSNPEADAMAAAAQAAFVVAAHQYPDKVNAFTELREQQVASNSMNARQQSGFELGTAAATAILEERGGDGWNAAAEYDWHPMAPGVYAEFNEHSGTPEGFIFGAGWARAKGFALASPDQFRSPPPPAIQSDEYTQAYNEVKSVGRFQSMRRTPDQAHLALWWKDFVENSHNRLARDLVDREGLNLAAANRLFALVNMSIFDAYVSSFDNKFFYNHWRPYTAIRWAANDGNPDTAPEESWTNLHRHTYAFPSYPSAHGTASAAAMSAFAHVFGDDYEFTMRIPVVDIAGPFSGKIQMQPATRSFSRFSDAARECALSRVYLGIHFRYDSTEGFVLGQKVGQNALARLPVKKPTTSKSDSD